MKNFCMGIFFAVAVIFFSQNNVAEANEVFMGNYPTSGYPTYLITETVKKYESGFDCTVVYYCRNKPYYTDYSFYKADDGFYYNSDGNRRILRVSEGAVVEFNIYKYVWLGER